MMMMASSSGNSSTCTKFLSSGSEEDLQALMDQRKRKRKQSNRESARRSRMRKQRHLDELIAEVERLRKENTEMLTRVNVTTQHYLKIEVENCILRTQMGELTQWLQSLNHIISNTTTTGFYQTHQTDCFLSTADYNNYNYNNNFMNSINMAYLNQPMVASADMFQCFQEEVGFSLGIRCFWSSIVIFCQYLCLLFN
ncbi:hypothetical protein RJT34_25757 [Clitoria ternatea]|uniref:BZIP domain-containing protein n=1 Tax=Clitoria ternatea TaxID=43366 RepID=A0AAN9IK90_CLITE